MAEIEQIWDRKLQEIRNTQLADRKIAETAVNSVYAAINLPAPDIVWHKGEHELLIDTTDTAFPIQRLMDRVLFGVWFKIPEIDRALRLLGYNYTTGMFNMNANKTTIFQNYFHVRRAHMEFRRGFSRPPWTRDFGNIICQFDAPIIALYEYAVSNHARIERDLRTLGDALKHLLNATFGAILFENACVLLDRPQSISFDETHLLSSRTGPAFDTRNMLPRWTGNGYSKATQSVAFWAVNGVALPAAVMDNRLRKGDHLTLSTIAAMRTPQQRVAAIEYIGWDWFVKMNQSVRQVLDRSKWGTLFTIQSGTQELVILEVTNSTKEADGTFRKYVMPVDHFCRPLPNPLDPHGTLGEPQPLTALNAVASTFGMTGRAYEAMLGAES